MKPIQTFLESLKEKGIRLWIEDSQVHYKAPKEVFTSSICEELSQRKQEIINFLQITPIEKKVKKVPLSITQERLWLSEQFTPNSSIYNIYFSLKFQGNLNITALQKAVQTILNRHKVLCTTFFQKEGSHFQEVADMLQIEPLFIDLKTIPK